MKKIKGKRGFSISSNNVQFGVEAENSEDAIKKFFEFVVKEDKIGQIGQIAIIHAENEGDVIPFRTMPALAYLGYFDKIAVNDALEAMVGERFSEEQLDEMMEKDSRWVRHLENRKNKWVKK